MNIFKREIKAHYKSLIGWSMGMFFLLLAGMTKFNAYQGSGEAANKLIAQFPKSLLAILGVTGLDLSTALRFYGCLYLYILLMIGAHAAMIGAEIISKEERDKTIEFLISKPISRIKILTEKIIAALVNIIILNIVTTIVSIWVVSLYNKGPAITNDIIMMMTGVLFFQLIFFTIGIFFATILKRSKAAVPVSTSILVGTYIISVVVDINSKLEKIKYFTPFKYFDAKILIADGKLDTFYLGISIFIIIFLTAMSYLVYAKRDLFV